VKPVDAVKVGDLVRMKTHETGLVGIVVDRDYHRSSIQIGIKWFGGSGKMDWEPESWLEVVSESR
tara:strand:+ start:2105 stop:2299 length:195 start_codon:yes stop_codon:yes gene_type:complete